MVKSKMEFEWNESKEKENIRKHGIPFAKGIECFFDPLGIVLEDIRHSSQEKRLFWVGKDASGRILTTRFTRRGSKIRIIGCAEWRKYRKVYDETTSSK